jgi:TRAP-type C4-dicarboxylate transport system permease large subunit
MEVVIRGTTPFLLAYVLLALLLIMFPQIVTTPLRWMT